VDLEKIEPQQTAEEGSGLGIHAGVLADMEGKEREVIRLPAGEFSSSDCKFDCGGR
jgi:hypothetical protein